MTNNMISFQPLTGIYEPSAIQQLADGHFLVVEDEKEQPFSLVTISPAGGVSTTPLLPGPQPTSAALRKLNDLEAVAIDRAGYIYAITSHSRDAEGDEKKSRDQLLRFRIEDGHVTAAVWAHGLKPALLAKHPVLAAAAEIRDVKSGGGLNIEGLEFSPDQQQLLIGFRSPLLDQCALIACIENPSEIFEAGESPRISATLQTLNLGGNGIRSLCYLHALNGYLVISGPVGRAKAEFQLWFWSGRVGERARHVSVPGLQGFANAEGVSHAVIDGRPRIILVSDDGNREEGRYARFLLLDAEMASCCFESCSIEYADFTASVGDQIAIAQCTGSLGYADSPHSQHVAKQLLCEMKLI